MTIDATGNGILAWQEPDDELIDRIWARRVFGGQCRDRHAGLARRRGTAQPLRAAADQFSLDAAGFGQGAIAYRQQPAPAAR